MKILVSAIACNPTLGSESLHGWIACRALANLGELWILASGEHELGIEESRAKGGIPDNIHFVFVGKRKPYNENRMIARFQSWGRYIKFSRMILPVARDLHAKIGFDLSHHVTYSTWRVGSPLWRLGIPFVWGPISGTEAFPLARFGGMLSPSARAFVAARIAGGWYSAMNPEVRRSAQNAFHIFAAHNEALPHLARLRGKSDGISVLSYYAFNAGTIASFARPEFKVRENAPLKILAGGNLEGRKGVAIALQGLALAKQRGAKFAYRITGKGPEEAHLKGLAASLGLGGEVIIGKEFSRDDYMRELKDSDLYLLPSLREGGGLTMMESMLAGCVPIVADCGGPGSAVTDECGVRVPVTTPEQMAGKIAAAVVRFDTERSLIPKMGAAAAARIAGHYSDANFLGAMKAVYNSALAVPTSPAS
jgi:glycosyltransferase involved in cell wall biosynthesis